MILDNWCQVNCNFFYSKGEVNFEEFNTQKSIKINPKKLTQEKFDELIEYFVFTEGYITKVETNMGNFAFYGVTHDFDVNQLKDRMKNYSTTQELYYFSNVDYFDYGFFAVANGGKIDRLLRYNSEAMGDEEVVYWVGKPHKWEYDTHTFYSKQRLEDCEMSFGWSEVCDMVYYYLPFVTKEVDIKSITVYSQNSNLKDVVKHILTGKPLKFSKDVTRQDEMDIFKMLVKNDSNFTSTDFFIAKDFLISYNYTLDTYDRYSSSGHIQILNTPYNSKILKSKLNKETFYEMFYNFVLDYKNATIKTMPTVAPMIRSLPECEHRLAQVITQYDYKTQKYLVHFCPGRLYDVKTREYISVEKQFFKVGKKFDRKTATKIYNYLKNYLEDYK